MLMSQSQQFDRNEISVYCIGVGGTTATLYHPCWKNTIVLPWYTMVNHGIAVVPHRCTMVYHDVTKRRYHNLRGTLGTILSHHGIPR